MSLGYAEKLSFIEDVGNVGMTEFFENSHALQEKVERLATLIQKSRHLVVFTGAGISTSCGIPDFRGPKGIWTLQREGKALPEASLPFHRAMPGLTHMALVELERAGILKYLISQNVDGLHLRSGIPREKLSELHGNSFMEKCPACEAEYFRDFEVESIGLKETSRRCADEKCGAKLMDTVLDWEDALPDKEMKPAELHCRKADVIICLGTSLQITPACNLPLKCLRGGGKIVIVNLQKTPKDNKASLVIHGLVDKVLTGAIKFLKMNIHPFVRIDLLQIILTQPLSTDKKYVNWTVRVASVHGLKAPLPFIKSVEVSFLDADDYKGAIIKKEPFLLKRRTLLTKCFELVLKLNFIEGCGCASTQVTIPIDFQVLTECFNLERKAVFERLREAAITESCSGQMSVVERKTILRPRTETAVYAVVTNLARYSEALEASSPSSGSLKRCVENGSEASRKKGSNGQKKKLRSVLGN